MFDLKKGLPGRVRFLDGLRGIAAIYVVIFHAYEEIVANPTTSIPSTMKFILDALLCGNIPVDIFIVLSGFCLMLSIVRSEGTEIPGGLFAFFKRRSKRILIPYYAAWALSTAAVLAVPSLTLIPGIPWYHAGSPLNPTVIVSHILLFQNLKPSWQTEINVPLWSVATEWQIYFLFPLLLLPLWRKYGLVSLGVVSAAIGILFAVPNLLVGGRLWLVALFSAGMIAAVLSHKSVVPSKRYLLSICIPAFATTLIGHMLILRPSILSFILSDYLVGIGTAAGLLIMCNSDRVSFLASGALYRLGLFSYSLYLCHAPVIAVVHAITWHFRLSPLASLASQFFISVPLSVLVSYLFHCLFERPLLRKPAAL